MDKAHLQSWTSRKTRHSRNSNWTLKFNRTSKEWSNYRSEYKDPQGGEAMEKDFWLPQSIPHLRRGMGGVGSCWYIKKRNRRFFSILLIWGCYTLCNVTWLLGAVAVEGQNRGVPRVCALCPGTGEVCCCGGSNWKCKFVRFKRRVPHYCLNLRNRQTPNK